MTEETDAASDVGLHGPVLVVGAGLIGSSVAMALVRAGVETYVTDSDPTTAHVASSRGAGSDKPMATEPELVVIATPPDALAAEVAVALDAFPDAVVTDVGSVKAKPLAELRQHRNDLSRYVGGHPMAGSERSGPLAAAADLFDGRRWAVVERSDCDQAALALVKRFARTCGADVVTMSTEEHDLAVARTSHLPHLMAALTAGQLTQAPTEHLALSGQGVRDVTRIAAGDPQLWRQIVTANASALTVLLTELRGEVDVLLESLQSGDGEPVQRILTAGAAGAGAVPGKHGAPALAFGTVLVAIPDEPGALARLFTDARDAGVNIEDLRIDHDPGRAFGLMEIDVDERDVETLIKALRTRDWSAHR